MTPGVVLHFWNGTIYWRLSLTGAYSALVLSKASRLNGGVHESAYTTIVTDGCRSVGHRIRVTPLCATAKCALVARGGAVFRARASRLTGAHSLRGFVLE